MNEDILRKAPFDLDDAGIDWVRRTLESMDRDARIRHLFIQICQGYNPGEAERIKRLAPAGIARFFGPDGDGELETLAAVHAAADIPHLVCCDLEGSRGSLPFATEMPNPLALAAIDDVETTANLYRIMAEEARAAGVNWSFTPLLDINAKFRSPIVATRSFGSDPDRILRNALAEIAALQENGVAATAKHWPGEGHDDRDQHLLTTVNPLSMEEWDKTHGRLYRAAIAKGVLSVMSAHIALPAFVAESDPNAGVEAFRPATVSRLLNEKLLREKLGFNGVIVSDATPMAGLGAWGPRHETLPEIISSGCDLILFSDDPDADFDIVATAAGDGRVSAERMEEAVTRTLGLKAALGLHLKPHQTRRDSLRRPENVAAAQAATARVPTLVKDVDNLLPVSVEKHRRVLVFSTGIVSPLGGDTPLVFPDLMRAEGFEVTVAAPGEDVDFSVYDLCLYLFGEETLLTRGRIFLDWNRLGGNMWRAMQRPWHDMPTVMISFGYPYYLYDAPRAPVMINAYATTDSMQEATLSCLLGRAPFEGRSPVDAFCGLEDARY